MIALTMTLLGLLGAFSVVLFFISRKRTTKTIACPSLSKKLKRIALLVDEHDSHGILHVKHFTTKLGSYKNFSCVFERHVVNESTFESYVRHIIDSQASLIYVQGLDNACGVYDVCMDTKREIPILFAETQGATLQSDSFERRYPVKGILQAPPNFNEHLSSMKRVLPSISNVLLVCGSSSNIYRKSDRYSEVTKAFQEHALTFQPFYTSGNDDIAGRISQHIDQFDLVTVLYDALTAHQLSDIIHVCATNKIPLFTTDLSALNQGATFAFGATITTVASNLARMAATFLSPHILWNEPSIVHLDQAEKLFVNEKMLQAIGKPLDSNLSIILKYADLIDKNSF